MKLRKKIGCLRNETIYKYNKHPGCCHILYMNKSFKN